MLLLQQGELGESDDSLTPIFYSQLILILKLTHLF